MIVGLITLFHFCSFFNFLETCMNVMCIIMEQICNHWSNYCKRFFICPPTENSNGHKRENERDYKIHHHTHHTHHTNTKHRFNFGERERSPLLQQHPPKGTHLQWPALTQKHKIKREILRF